MRPADEESARAVAAATGLHPVAARVLAARGVADGDAARRFLEPRLADLRPPDGLAGLPEAVELLAAAVRARRTVGVFGDYDVDGVTAAAALAGYLGSLGVPVVVHVARREAGYGFGAAEAAALADAGAQVVVTLDCGTSDHEPIAALRARGVDVIVVDHHQVPAGDSPATALVNPHRPDATFPFRGLCSAGLAFYLCATLRTRLGRDGAPDARNLLDLAALGTIADVAPLVEENRVIATHGLRAISRGLRPGLRALAALSEIAGDVGAREVAFRLAPRLNAPGRLGEARPALDLLLARDEAEGAALARACDEKNRQRQAIQERVEAEARAQAEGDARPFLLLAGEGWHPGVVGIVAARIAERFAKPAAVVGIEGGVGRGSARSAAGVNLYELLATARDRFVRFGGHAAACGFTVHADAIDSLREALAAAMEARRETAAPALLCDAEARGGDLTLELALDLARLAPFGAGNPEPLLLARDLEVRQARVVGQAREHLTLQLGAGAAVIGAIGFGMASRDVPVGARVTAAFHLDVDAWQGVRSPRMRLRELEVESVARAVP